MFHRLNLKFAVSKIDCDGTRLELSGQLAIMVAVLFVFNVFNRVILEEEESLVHFHIMSLKSATRDASFQDNPSINRRMYSRL